MISFHTTAEDAEDALYDAIARADVDALMAVWSEDEDIVCIHPTGQRMDGHAAIRESWRSIFEGNPRFSVHIRSKVRWESTLISVHSVVETLHLENDETAHGPMLTTNVFIRGTNGWRLLSRHTSAAAEHADVADDLADGHHRHTLH